MKLNKVIFFVIYALLGCSVVSAMEKIPNNNDDINLRDPHINESLDLLYKESLLQCNPDEKRVSQKLLEQRKQQYEWLKEIYCEVFDTLSSEKKEEIRKEIECINSFLGIGPEIVDDNAKRENICYKEDLSRLPYKSSSHEQDLLQLFYKSSSNHEQDLCQSFFRPNSTFNNNSFN